MTGSLDKATRWASRVGQGVGFLLIAWGVGVLLQGALLGGMAGHADELETHVSDTLRWIKDEAER